MPLALPNRTRFSTGTSGIGTITVGTAITGFQTPATANVPVGSIVGYGIEDGAAWEVGVGTYQAGGLITRDVVEASSAGGSKISLSGTATAFLTLTGGIVTPLWDSRGRNKICNPLFRVQQRGVGPWTANATFTVDRWLLNLVTDTVSVAPIALTDTHRTSIGDEEATSGLQITVTGNAATTALTALSQRIEDLRRLAGKTVTVSFYAMAPAAGFKLGVSIDQSFGTGGSPSAAVQGVGQSVTLGTAFARYSLTLAVPSAIGKVVGTNSDHYTQINLWASAGASSATRAGGVGVQTGAPILWGVQVEVGPVASPLEKPEPALDLEACQRFFQVGQLSWSGYAMGGGTVALSNLPPVTMRAAPTMSLSTNSSTAVGTPVLSSNAMIFYVTATVTGSTLTNFAVVLNVTYQASSEL